MAAALEPARRLTAAAQRFGRLVEQSAAPGYLDSNAAELDQAGNTVLPEVLAQPGRLQPSPGWRAALCRLSGGLLNIPPSIADLRRLDTITKVRAPVAAGHHRIAVLSMKGGVGKTTIAVGVGSVLASLRSDRVIALDADPDRGTLADKVPQQHRAGVGDLVRHRESIARHEDMRRFTSQAASGLEVLAAGQGGFAAAEFGANDFLAACATLERFYAVSLADCGTGLTQPAMSGVLTMTDQIVLVTTACIDSARSGSITLDWLAARGHGDLARNAVVVINAVPRHAGHADVGMVERHFAARCGAVTRVPYDHYLARGADFDLDQIAASTADGLLSLAALLADGFTKRRVWDSNPR